jgi:hypothetical protein
MSLKPISSLLIQAARAIATTASSRVISGLSCHAQTYEQTIRSAVHAFFRIRAEALDSACSQPAHEEEGISPRGRNWQAKRAHTPPPLAHSLTLR